MSDPEPSSKPAAPVAERRPPPKSAEPIPVAVLVFVGSSMRLPGAESVSSLTAGGDPKRAHHEITYLPFMRHHMVVFYENDKKPPQVSYVHESQVLTWKPASSA